MHRSAISLPELSERTRRALVLAGLCVWLATVGAGLGLLAEYSHRAGAATAPPVDASQPAASSPRKPRLLMFAHPRCPCTAASLSELARLTSRCAGELDATVYFYRPDGAPDSWVTGSLWNSAAAIPGVDVRIDPRGQTAARFGSTTSGDVLLYDATGRLRFHGGITPARGHEGDSLGKSAVISIVTGDSANVDCSPVFGCTIRPSTRVHE